MSLPVTLLKKRQIQGSQENEKCFLDLTVCKYSGVKRMRRSVSWIWLFAHCSCVHRSVCTSFYPPLCLHIVLLTTVLLSFSVCLSPISLNCMRSQCTAFAGAHTWMCVKRNRVCSESQENSILYRLWKAMASQHHLKGEQRVKWVWPKT